MCGRNVLSGSAGRSQHWRALHLSSWQPWCWWESLPRAGGVCVHPCTSAARRAWPGSQAGGVPRWQAGRGAANRAGEEQTVTSQPGFLLWPEAAVGQCRRQVKQCRAPGCLGPGFCCTLRRACEEGEEQPSWRLLLRVFLGQKEAETNGEWEEISLGTRDFPFSYANSAHGPSTLFLLCNVYQTSKMLSLLLVNQVRQIKHLVRITSMNKLKCNSSICA